MGQLPNDLKDYMAQNREFRSFTLEQCKNPVKLPNRYKNSITGEPLNFLKGLLELSPKTRLTAKEALYHPYFKKNRESDSEMAEENKHKNLQGEELSEPMDERQIDELSGRHNQLRINSQNTNENSKRGSTFNKVQKVPTEEAVKNMTSIQSMPKTYYNIYESQSSDKKKPKANWSSKNYGNKDLHDYKPKFFYTNETSGGLGSTMALGNFGAKQVTNTSSRSATCWSRTRPSRRS